MATTAVQDRVTLSPKDVRDHLSLPATCSDLSLELWISAAKEAADAYMKNPFVDSDGADVAIPSRVTMGVLEWVRVQYYRDTAHREREAMSTLGRQHEGAKPGVRAGQVASEIAQGDDRTKYLSPEASSVYRDVALHREDNVKQTYWAPYKRPGRLSADTDHELWCDPCGRSW